MIRHIILPLLAILFVPEITSGDELDGYLWERMDVSHKTLLMAGYVSGFWHGTVYGTDFGVNTSSSYLKDISKTRVYGVRKFKDYSRCGASLDKNRETILKAAAKYARNSLDKSVEYYVAEVDSFYKQYPLCKGKDLTEMLTDISLVWLTLRNYQDVGEECSKNVAPAAAHGKPMNWRIE